MRKTGRVLWLSDAQSLTAQLDGEALDPNRSARPELRYGVNTDLIINGAACTLGYTPEILGPHFLAGLDGVVEVDAIRGGGFQIVAAGRAYGSGSSREVAVTAHRGAGIELVVAESLQRIFQENLVYAGLPFTTDFEVLDRLEAGEDIDPEVFTAALPPFFRAVAEQGGLLEYGRALQRGALHPPSPSTDRRPMTVAEKLIARRTLDRHGAPGVEAVAPGDQVLCQAGFRGLHEYTAGMVMSLYEQGFGKVPVHAPEQVACFEDHFVLLDAPSVPETVRLKRLGSARKMADEMVRACEEHGLALHGPGRDRPGGVCHRIVVEDYAVPGDIVILTDSHSPTAGVLNCFAFGVGSSAMAFALRTGWVPVTVPKTVRVELSGTPRGGLAPKDVILHVIGQSWARNETWRTSPTDTCAMEWGGPALNHWSVDELSVLTNMSVEGGFMTGVLEPCRPVEAFLRSRRGRSDWTFTPPDEDAQYARVERIHLDDVPLTVATPGDARNRAPLEAHEGTPIQNVVIASCTGGSLADLRSAAEVLRGRKVATGCRLTVTPSSEDVANQAHKEGLLELFRTAGAEVTAPGCGSCIGNGPGIPEPGETTASTTNRNFDRRMGAPGPVFLVNPAVAAAAAVTGALRDPRRL